MAKILSQFFNLDGTSATLNYLVNHRSPIKPGAGQLPRYQAIRREMLRWLESNQFLALGESSYFDTYLDRKNAEHPCEIAEFEDANGKNLVIRYGPIKKSQDTEDYEGPTEIVIRSSQEQGDPVENITIQLTHTGKVKLEGRKKVPKYPFFPQPEILGNILKPLPKSNYPIINAAQQRDYGKRLYDDSEYPKLAREFVRRIWPGATWPDDLGDNNKHRKFPLLVFIGPDDTFQKDKSKQTAEDRLKEALYNAKMAEFQDIATRLYGIAEVLLIPHKLENEFNKQMAAAATIDTPNIWSVRVDKPIFFLPKFQFEDSWSRHQIIRLDIPDQKTRIEQEVVSGQGFLNFPRKPPSDNKSRADIIIENAIRLLGAPKVEQEAGLETYDENDGIGKKVRRPSPQLKEARELLVKRNSEIEVLKAKLYDVEETYRELLKIAEEEAREMGRLLTETKLEALTLKGKLEKSSVRGLFYHTTDKSDVEIMWEASRVEFGIPIPRYIKDVQAWAEEFFPDSLALGTAFIKECESIRNYDPNRTEKLYNSLLLLGLFYGRKTNPAYKKIWEEVFNDQPIYDVIKTFAGAKITSCQNAATGSSFYEGIIQGKKVIYDEHILDGSVSPDSMFRIYIGKHRDTPNKIYIGKGPSHNK